MRFCSSFGTGATMACLSRWCEHHLRAGWCEVIGCACPVRCGGAVLVPLLAEFKRRRVFRALIAYGIAAFAVLQISEPVLHALHLPEWTLTFMVVALGAGFPIVILLAWALDVSGSGIERTAPIRPDRKAGLEGVRLGLILVGVGLLAAAPGITWHFLVRRGAQAPLEHAS